MWLLPGLEAIVFQKSLFWLKVGSWPSKSLIVGVFAYLFGLTVSHSGKEMGAGCWRLLPSLSL
jgi:hypothetical protein